MKIDGKQRVKRTDGQGDDDDEPDKERLDAEFVKGMG